MFTSLKIAIRSMRRDWSTNALVVAVLGVGIASVLIIFGLLKAIVIDPPPFEHARSTYKLGYQMQGDERLQEPLGKELVEWQRLLTGMGEISGVSGATVNLSDSGRPERYEGSMVWGDIFGTIGVAPVLGRSFNAADFGAGATPVLLLSDRIWRNRFQADPAIIGKTVRANGVVTEIVGVMPPDFSFPYLQEIWLARDLNDLTNSDRENGFETYFRANSATEATRAVASLNAWLTREKQTSVGSTAQVERDQQIGVASEKLTFSNPTSRALLALMMAGVVMLLLVACGNAGSILLVKVMAQTDEQALKLALGARFWQLAKNLLLQNVILALISAGVAMVLANYGTHFVMTELGEDGLPAYIRVGDFRTNALWSLIFSLAATLLTLILPLLSLRRNSLGGALKDSGRTMMKGSKGHYLVALQVAFSCAVLVNTFAIISMVRNFETAGFGVDEGPILSGRIALFESRYADNQAVQNHLIELRRRLEGIAGVESATISSVLPGDLAGQDWVVIPGEDPSRPSEVFAGAVDPEFAKTLGVRLLAGRFFTVTDTATSDAVVVIDEGMAKRLGVNGPDYSAVIGQQLLRVTEDGNRVSTIVGVINQMQLDELDDSRDMTVLSAIAQTENRFFSVIVRARPGIDPASLKVQLPAEVAQADPDMPVYWLRTYAEIRQVTQASERVIGYVFSSMGVIALLLSAAGCYGLLAFIATRREREFGLRRALGAQAAALSSALLTRTGIFACIGACLGLLLGIPAANSLSNVMSRMGSVELAASMAVACLFGALIAASILPLLRTLRIQPQVALRGD